MAGGRFSSRHQFFSRRQAFFATPVDAKKDCRRRPPGRTVSASRARSATGRGHGPRGSGSCLAVCFQPLPRWLPHSQPRHPSRPVLSGLYPVKLSHCGPRARGPTLQTRDCSPASRDSLPDSWPGLPGQDSHPLDLRRRPCPAARAVPALLFLLGTNRHLRAR